MALLKHRTLASLIRNEFDLGCVAPAAMDDTYTGAAGMHHIATPSARDDRLFCFIFHASRFPSLPSRHPYTTTIFTFPAVFAGSKRSQFRTLATGIK